jgi:hypothetical protein
MAPDEGDTGTGACGRDGLIRPLSAGVPGKFPAKQCLSRPGQVRTLEDEIGIRAADDDEAGRTGNLHHAGK